MTSNRSTRQWENLYRGSVFLRVLSPKTGKNPSLKSPWRVPFNFFSCEVQFAATFAFPFLYFAVTLCRYGYDRVREDAVSEDIFYHQECQRAYAWHASLWSLVSIYPASYFILLIGKKAKTIFVFSLLVTQIRTIVLENLMRYLGCHISNIKMP